MEVENTETKPEGQEGPNVKEEESSSPPKPLPPIPRAAELASAHEEEKRLYWDRSHYDSPASQIKALVQSATLYIGNLAFSSRSRHIRAHFSLVGPVKMVKMGLDRHKKSPCGFCFVEYVHRADALKAVAHLSGTKLDGSVIRVELDAGFQPGRQYGRGVRGGQVRDDRRGADQMRAKRGRDSLERPPPKPEEPKPEEENTEEPSAKRQRTEQ